MLKLRRDGISDLSYAVMVAVGPQAQELNRLADLVESIAAFDQGRCTLVMVDDHPTPRGLDRLIPIPSAVRAVSLHHQRPPTPIKYRRGKGICSAVLLAWQFIQKHTDAELVLKLDTDSLIIAPYLERLATKFEQNGDLGIAGAYDRTPAGKPRDFTEHANTVARLHQWRFDWRRPLSSIAQRHREPYASIRRHIATAFQHGYKPGEHCLGGGYAVARALLDRMAHHGYLDHPELWLGVDCPEDVMMGIYTRACGMTMASAVEPGDVFGVSYIGLPDTPEALLARGYAVIHAVKNDSRLDEVTIREFFRARRTSLTTSKANSA